MKINYETVVITEQELSEKSYKDIKGLVSICNDKDNTYMKFYLDGKEKFITKILFYYGDNLIAYFGITPSYKERESLVWGTIHPDYRTSVIFTEFFNHIKDKCIENNVDVLKFINERGAIYFKDFIISTGAKVKYSTYEMSFNKKYYNEDIGKCTDIILNKSTIADLDDIIPIGMEAFGTTEKEEKSYNESNLNDPKYSTFICKINNTPVGIISVSIKNGEGSIADLAVLKEYRGRGIGRAILSKTIAYLINEGFEKFRLSVELENKNALSLYEHSGFRIVKIIDCYEMKI